MLQFASRRGGLPGPGGVLLALGECLPVPGGGFSLPGGFSLSGGVSAWSGGGSPCPETPPVNRITHTCKNITLATTSLRPVKIRFRLNLYK